MLSRRHWITIGPMGAALLLFLATAAAAPLPQAAGAQAGVDPAYVQGYLAGYPAGQADREAQAPANPHKFSAYQRHSAVAYRSGFSDGYADGYAGRAASIVPPAPPAAESAASGNGGAPSSGAAPAAAPAGAAAITVKQGRSIGYREGYSAGEFDAGRNAPFGYADNAEYQHASAGYNESMGDLPQFQTGFRQGFQEGYSDGYHHHLYNSAIGVRSDVEIPGTVNPPPPPAGPLPTSPEVARALESGNYSNGTLVAEGTILQTRLDTTITTKDSRAGDPFQATVTVPVWVGAKAVIPAGSTITGTVASVKRGGHFHGNAEIQLQFDTLRLPGGVAIPLHAQVNGVGEGATQTDVNGNEGTIQRQGQGSAKKIATTTGVGAVLGAIFGGGRGLAIGGISGAAVGTAGVLMNRQRDLKLYTGESLAIRLDRPLLLHNLPAS